MALGVSRGASGGKRWGGALDTLCWLSDNILYGSRLRAFWPTYRTPFYEAYWRSVQVELRRLAACQ